VPLESEREGAGPRVVLVHGFGQTGRCWGPLAPALARRHEVVRVDAPGHGGSAAVAADLPATGRLLAEAGGPAVYLGYSMGGRMVLHVAAHAPEALRALVVVGGTPGIADAGERAARHASDLALAARIRSGGVPAFVREWLAMPMFAGLPPEGRFVAERERNTADGLATSLELAGTGAQAPLWDALAAIDVPVLWVAGAEDERYAAIAHDAAAAIGPNARAALVPGAGHSTHLEAPGPFIDLVSGWLAEVSGG
jgi:2-succinyl-6-hydroxy-2,4-cyclohexadiene-1-carboxylate synthase